MKLDNYDIEQYQLYKSNLDKYLIEWSLQSRGTFHIIRQVVEKIVISDINIIYYLNPKSLEYVFNFIITKQEVYNYEVQKMSEKECEIITMPYKLKRVNQGKTIIIGNQKKIVVLLNY